MGITQQAQSLDYEKIADEKKLQKRLIERVRSLYYQNDLSKALPARKVESLALPYESYKLAFTSGLLSEVYKGKIASADLQALLKSGEGGYKDLDTDDNFWIPSGRQIFASAKFYLPTEFIDPYSFLYSDGFGREIQTKIQAEGGKAPQREADVALDSGYHLPGKLSVENGKLKHADTKHRWVGTGRTIYNNKGKPVRQYEPFFSSGSSRVSPL